MLVWCFEVMRQLFSIEFSSQAAAPGQSGQIQVSRAICKEICVIVRLIQVVARHADMGIAVFLDLRLGQGFFLDACLVLCGYASVVFHWFSSQAAAPGQSGQIQVSLA